MIWEGWRYITAVETVGIFVTLGVLSTWLRGVRGLDYTARMLTLMLVFGTFAYATGAALGRGLPVQDYNRLLAVALALFWLTLLTPWRWRTPRRRRER